MLVVLIGMVESQSLLTHRKFIQPTKESFLAVRASIFEGTSHNNFLYFASPDLFPTKLFTLISFCSTSIRPLSCSSSSDFPEILTISCWWLLVSPLWWLSLKKNPKKRQSSIFHRIFWRKSNGVLKQLKGRLFLGILSLDTSIVNGSKYPLNPAKFMLKVTESP